MTLPPSDHFNGKTFFAPGDPFRTSLRDLLKWQLSGGARPWPASVEVGSVTVPDAPVGDGLVATWIGHSTFLLRTAGAAILTDPIFSDRASPVSWAGPRRVAPPALQLDALPKIDLVLLSHDHYDHCDLPSLRRLARRDNPLVVTPLGYRSLLAGVGLRRVTELDWWQASAGDPGLEVTLVPARHWTRRTPLSTNARLWGGFMLKAGNRRVYFAGDTGYRDGLFASIGDRCGAPDLALIPIGAYEPRWFMEPMHMNPADAVRAHVELGARRSFAMHWGTFQMTDEGRDEPLEALADARAQAGISADEFAAPPLGSSMAV